MFNIGYVTKELKAVSTGTAEQEIGRQEDNPFFAGVFIISNGAGEGAALKLTAVDANGDVVLLDIQNLSESYYIPRFRVVDPTGQHIEDESQAWASTTHSYKLGLTGGTADGIVKVMVGFSNVPMQNVGT